MDEKNQNQENLETIEESAQTEAQLEAASEKEPKDEEAVLQEELEGKSKPEPKAQPEKKKKASFFKGNKFKRGGMATVMTVVFIAIVVVINLLVSILSDRFPSMNVDLTAQKMNTLSEQALDVAKSVEQETTIYLIGAEDSYRNDTIYSNYGLQYSQVANLAERLAEANQNIKVEFIEPDTNPEFISRYADENLATGRVMVKTDKRYKVLTVDDMFSMSQNSTTGGTDMFSKVDSALAGALEMANLDKVPVFTLATGHGEMLNSTNMAAFLKMMEDQNFQVEEIDLMTEEIPEDTQILMLPTPTTDYTEEELAKLRALLADQERQESIAVLATFYPNQGNFPNLNNFLEEWGIEVETGAVVAENDDSRYLLANPSYVLVDSTSETMEGTYDRLVSPASVPIKLLFSGNGEVGTDALWTTASSAYTITENSAEEEMENPVTSQQVVASKSSALAQFDNKFYNRSVIVFGSSQIFTDSFMETAFSNRQYISDLLKLATDTGGSSVTVYTERVQTNTLDVMATQNTIIMLGLGVFTIGLPLVILAAGLVIFLKRRHL